MAGWPIDKLIYIGGGAAAVVALVFAWNFRWDSGYDQGVIDANNAARLAAVEVDKAWRNQERAKQTQWDETYERLSKEALLARDAAASADASTLGLRDQISAGHARAAEAARAASRSERAATAAWDVLQECRAEYTALAKEAERILNIAWKTREYSLTVGGR